MPIAAQCGSCAARYKIVDTAAGRRVRCRRCGKPLQVPGGVMVEQLDLHALADLERKGRIIETPETAMEQYQSAVATRSGGAVAKDPNAKEKGRSYAELAVGADMRKMAKAKGDRRAATAGAISDGMPMPLIPMIVTGGICVLLVVLGLFSPSMAFVSLIILGGGAVLFTIWAALEARAVLMEEEFVVRLLWRFMPLYRAYFLITRWREMLKSMILHCIGAFMGILALIAFVMAAPKVHELLNSDHPYAMSSSAPGKLNSFGEESDPNDKPPPDWPEGVPYIKHREQPKHAKLPKLLIDSGAGIDPFLKPPPGWKDEIEAFLKEKLSSNGLVNRKGAQLSVVAAVQDSGTRDVMFEEKDGAYTPSEKGTVKARVSKITCQVTLSSLTFELGKQEKDIPEPTWPIRPKPGQTLQNAILEEEFKSATEIFKTMKYPDKAWWEQHDPDPGPD